MSKLYILNLLLYENVHNALEIIMGMQNGWTTTQISKIFRIKDRYKSRQTLINAEEKGLIPTAERASRGKISVRLWPMEQLPDIGREFGFMEAPKKQVIASIYFPKGGVLKSTLSYTLARIAALNGIKTLVIGQDVQCTITDLILPEEEYDNMEQARTNDATKGLFHHLIEGAPLGEVIRETDIPTLHIIPETSDLNLLEKKIRDKTRREFYYLDNLIPKLDDYDLIIFDNGPNWNMLVENCLTACNNVISPVGCDWNSFKAVERNLSMLEEYRDAVKTSWHNYFLVPTLLETNKLSQQIYGAYLTNFAGQVIEHPIRRTIKGQEALVMGGSIFEYDPSSPLANDYYDLVKKMWSQMAGEATQPLETSSINNKISA